MKVQERAIRRHYTSGDLAGRVLATLDASGRPLDTLTLDDLPAYAHFHTRGRDATVELAGLIDLSAGQRVLDLGGGLGGAARLLAAQFACSVTVLDLTEEYVRVGEMLTRRLGLSERVRFEVGTAVAVPFEDGSFDRVITQHMSMNVPDKRRLYGEAARVLRRGGLLGIHEIVAGSGGAIHLPVPWARRARESHLPAPAALRRMMDTVGLQERIWIDETGRAAAWFGGRAAAWQAETAGAKAAAPHLLMGTDWGAMLANLARNLAEGRARVVQGAFVRR
jgi:MPBQ/MSBQ methyltransferase